jgi:hypothetical protein
MQSKVDAVDAQSSSKILSNAQSTLDEIKKINPEENKNELLHRQLSKLNELYGLTEYARQYKPHLDTILQRLRTLKNIHENAALIINKAQSLYNQKEIIFHSVEDCKFNVREVSNGLIENIQIIEKNMAYMNQKIAQLISKPSS